MRSKRKVLFIVLFIVFVFIAIISSIGFFGFKDSCEGLWDRHFVKDYEKNINSLEEAKEIFRELGYEQLKENSNQILVETQVEKSLMNIAQGEDKYSVSFMWTCYELHFNGELYSFWCGD
ncbi:MAG: hypothetical protein ABIH37_05405 [archaeon]